MSGSSCCSCYYEPCTADSGGKKSTKFEAPLKRLQLDRDITEAAQHAICIFAQHSVSVCASCLAAACDFCMNAQHEFNSGVAGCCKCSVVQAMHDQQNMHASSLVAPTKMPMVSSAKKLCTSANVATLASTRAISITPMALATMLRPCRF